MKGTHLIQSGWDVKQLLKQWKLENIWPHLLAENIDGEILQMIKIPHIRMLLGNFPLGIQIRFEHNLEQWRFEIGRPLQQMGYIANSELSTNKQPIQAAQAMYNRTEPPKCNATHENIVPTELKKSQPHNPPPEIPQTRSLASTPTNKTETSTMPYTSKPNGPIPKVNLREILMKSQPEGPQLIQIYKARNSFCRLERRRLVSIIVNYYLRDDRKFCLQTSYALERAILKMFPTERLEEYRRAKRGSIYCKYMSAKPVYAKRQRKNSIAKLRQRKLNRVYNEFEQSDDVEAVSLTDETVPYPDGDGDNRISSGCYSINEDDSMTPHVSNMADDDDDAQDDDAKSLYSYSYVNEKEGKDVKPTILQETEIPIQTAYKLHREVIKIKKPFIHEIFLDNVCTIYGTLKTDDHFLAVNDCEIHKDEFESVIRQYYRLPTFVVELKQRSSSSSELDIMPDNISDKISVNNSDTDINVPDTNLPNAKDIRNIPPLRHIVMISNASKPLENKHRTSIAKAVIDECLSLQPDRSLKRQEYLTLAQSICEAFPGEKEITYYVPSQPNHPARGKLWCSFKNKRHFLASTGVLKTRPLRRCKKSLSSGDERQISSDNQDEQNEEHNAQLQFEETSLTNIESIKSKWLETHQQRWGILVKEKLTPSEYMEKYPILKTLEGIKLLDIDMHVMYPEMGNIKNWMEIYTKVMDKIKTKRLPEKIKKLIKIITEANDETYRASLALLLLPYLFPHNGRKNELSGAKGTKLEIQERFIKEFQTLEDLHSDANTIDLQLRYVHSAQHIIYAEFSISGFIFKCNDLLEALNCLFFYMLGMNIQFPLSCNHIWQFVQYAIYRIEFKGVKWPYVESVISDLYLS